MGGSTVGEVTSCWDPNKFDHRGAEQRFAEASPSAARPCVVGGTPVQKTLEN